MNFWEFMMCSSGRFVVLRRINANKSSLSISCNGFMLFVLKVVLIGSEFPAMNSLLFECWNKRIKT